MTNTPVFYSSLVDWFVLDDLVARLHPSEQSSAQLLIVKMHDYIVHETILHQLDQQDHAEYLEKCLEMHHDEGLLAWLESKVERVRSILQEVLAALSQTLHELLGVVQPTV